MATKQSCSIDMQPLDSMKESLRLDAGTYPLGLLHEKIILSPVSAVLISLSLYTEPRRCRRQSYRFTTRSMKDKRSNKLSLGVSSLVQTDNNGLGILL